MAGIGPGILINIGADASKAVKEITAFNKVLGKQMTSMEKFRKGVDKAFLPAVGALSAMGVAAVASAKKASDLAETQSKVGQIFGQSAKELDKWAKAAPNALGQTEQAALDAASTMATFGKAAGLTGTELVEFSTSLTDLSSDLASFYNTDPADAVQALGAALRGEYEGLRRYGVLLNDQALKQEAMALGIYKGTGALTAQQKVLAAQAAIMKQTSDAQGDFQRTADGAANQMRILQANLEQTQTELGQALLPLLQQAVTYLSKFAQWARENQGAVKALAAAITILAGAIVAAKVALIAYDTWIAAATLKTKVFGTTAATTTTRMRGLKGGLAGVAATAAVVGAQQSGLTDRYMAFTDVLDDNTTGMEKWIASAFLMAKEAVTGKPILEDLRRQQIINTDAAENLAAATRNAAYAQQWLNERNAEGAGKNYTPKPLSQEQFFNSIRGQIRVQREAREALEGTTEATEDASKATGGASKAVKEQTKYVKKLALALEGNLVDGYTLTIKKLDQMRPKARKALEGALADANQIISDSLNAAKQAMDQASREYEGAFQRVGDSVRGMFDMKAITDEFAKEGGNWQAAWEAQVKNAQWYSNVIQALIAQGAEQGLVDLILAQGPQGAALAEAMIKDNFIPTANADLASVDIWANGAGEAYAQKFYGPGVASAQTMLDAIEGTVNEQMDRLRRLGEKMGLAVAAGFNAKKPKEAAGVQARALPIGLTATALPGLTRTGSTAYTSSPRSGDGVQITVNTGVGDPVAIAKEIRRTLSRAGIRTGVAL